MTTLSRYDKAEIFATEGTGYEPVQQFDERC